MRLTQAKSMAKSDRKQEPKRKKRDETASVVASIVGCTPANVRMVMNGEVDNDTILDLTIEYRKGKTELIKHLESLVPFS